jgi:NAD(P)-dependent dehydrogenase (short-subunit alcohol dehydrogenase family)
MRAVRFSHNPLFLSVLLAHFLFYSEYNNNFYFRLGSGRKEKYGMENYKDKTAVITGGTSGLGLAIAKNIGKKGAHIFITGRREEKGKSVEQELRDAGIDATYIRQDISVEEDWDKMIEAVHEKTPVVDYLFNNAGVMTRPNVLLKTTKKDWEWIFQTNVWGPMYGLQKFTVLMTGQENGGSIITTASTASVAAFSMWAPYSVSKTALMRICECYATEAKITKNDKVKYYVSFPGVFESNISNATVYRDEQYKNDGEPEKEMPATKAGTLEGDKLGKITAEEAAQIILDEVDRGHFYIFTHPDLTTALILEQANAQILNKPIVDQATYDFGFYAKKLHEKGIDTKAASATLKRD